MKIMLRKIIVIIISFVTIGMMGSCEDIFNDLAVNPNQSDVNSFYTTLEIVIREFLVSMGIFRLLVIWELVDLV